MADLASQQVVNAVVARLVAAATDSGARVYSDRFHPIAAYPSTTVRHVNEDLSTDGDDVTWPPVQLHSLDLDVQVLVQAAADLDAAMSAAALQVLQALQGAAAPLAPLRVSLSAQRIRYQAQADGQAAHGVAVVSLQAQYQTNANAPDTII